ncbi:unnamed protein product [Schistosoma mattheei]|uniref:Uncharacterized protein n=1 Tax=Schistosoma mattheei TaxID=31246 RepID=A0A183PF93_9TREM|nr:unnamed protein product [Schistosoma mattheei]
MLQFNEDVSIKSQLTIISALKEHMLEQSNPESHSKIIDISNEVIKEEVDEAEKPTGTRPRGWPRSKQVR